MCEIVVRAIGHLEVGLRGGDRVRQYGIAVTVSAASKLLGGRLLPRRRCRLSLVVELSGEAQPNRRQHLVRLAARDDQGRRLP